MDLQLLGPIEATVDGRPIELGATKQRAVLAMLALRVNRSVSVDRLVEGVWGEHPPESAPKMVQHYISQLRKLLAGDGAAIVTHGRGYELQLAADSVDAERFEHLIAAAGHGAGNGAAREALALWRGDVLADVAGVPFASAEIRRLEELRLAAVEMAIDRDLASGRHREVVGELERLVLEEPLCEKLHLQRMLALYRSGRQADALEAYRQARTALVEQIGVEPGPELRRLQEAILRQDPSLETTASELDEPAPELETSTPLLGRETELDRLREHWRGARAGAGRLVLVTGPPGMGKTRLAAELAAEVQVDGGAVRYASGAGSPHAALAAVAGARVAQRPTLLVLDEADRIGAEVEAALGELVDGLSAMPVLVVATGEDIDRLPGARSPAPLTLAPLDADAVRELAQLYSGSRENFEVLVERLVQVSGGVPQQLHRVAREKAREVTVRRLGDAATRLAAERPALRAAEDDLVGSIVELHARRERTETDRRLDDRALVCPFKGLASFEVEDAEFFFGRERLVAEMVARLTGAPLTGIVGPSGSGKSSALRAGLLAGLAAGVLPGSERWPIALVRPGEQPLRALEQAVAQVVSQGRLVVAVDQFEEIFTACRDEGERSAFADALVACARDPHRRALVLVAVRADFYGHCAAYPELSRLLGANHVLVGPMRRDELRRAIELPARRAGLRVAPDLVEVLLGDVEGEPGALPLLSTALLELWQHRDGRHLQVSAYEHTGGVHGAVSRLAESAYERLDPDHRKLARRILLRLAGEGEGNAVVRRRVPLDELEGEGVAEVLAVLANDRLITIGEGEVEVAHEALLREWPRLRGWLEEDAQGRRLHLHLHDAARQWAVADRDSSELYRGARLAAVLDWSAGHEAELNSTESAFVVESRAASERAQRRLRAVLAGVAALLALAVAAGAVALEQRGNARTEATAADAQRAAAEAQRLGSAALAEDDLDRSLLLARQGMALHDSRQTRGNLLAALLKSPAAIGVLRGDGDRLIALDLSPDERTLAFIDNEGTLSFVDLPTRRPAGPPASVSGHAGVIIDSAVRLDHLRFSPDGSRIAVGGGEPRVLDVRTHRVLVRLRFSYDGFIYAMEFSPDGRTLFAAVGLPPDRVAIQRYDARTGEPEGKGRTERVGLETLMLSRDARRLVTTHVDEDTVIRDARTLREVQRWPVRAEQAALSPDNRTMLAGGADGSVRFLDLVSGHVTPGSGRHEAGVERVAFSPDGRAAITAARDGRMIVWDVERASARETLEGHSGQITGLAITRDSATLYTSGLDSKVLISDLAGARRLGRPFKVGPDNPEGPRDSLRPDGRVLAVGQFDGSVTLTDARTLRPISRFPVVPTGPVMGMRYVPGGKLLVVGGDNGFLALVDPRRGRIVRKLRGHRAPVTLTPSFSADGRLMATGSYRDSVRLWALPSGRPVGRPLRGPIRTSLSLSPDGRALATTRPESGGVEILDVATLRRRAILPGSKDVWDLIRFTPDGRFLVGGSWKGWAQLWSAKAWNRVGRRFTGHAGRVEAQSVSPDGETLATGGPDGAIRLWNMRTQQPLGAALPGLPNSFVAPQFTPDGKYLLAIYGDGGQAYRWDVRPSSWARHACNVAGRPLSRSEWQEALPERAYAPACTR